MGVREDIKILMIQSKWTLKELAEEITNRTGEKCLAPTLSQKLSRESLRYKEAKLIGEILGYELKFEKKK